MVYQNTLRGINFLVIIYLSAEAVKLPALPLLIYNRLISQINHHLITIFLIAHKHQMSSSSAVQVFMVLHSRGNCCWPISPPSLTPSEPSRHGYSTPLPPFPQTQQYIPTPFPPLFCPLSLRRPLKVLPARRRQHNLRRPTDGPTDRHTSGRSPSTVSSPGKILL